MKGEQRFVLLLHQNPGDGRIDHWDLMLQSGDTLMTFEIPRQILTKQQAELEFTAIQLPDHRLAYLTYEGRVSGNRGTVEQVDSGVYASPLPMCDFDHWIQRQTAIIRLSGRKFRGDLYFFLQPSLARTYQCRWHPIQPTCEKCR